MVVLVEEVDDEAVLLLVELGSVSLDDVAAEKIAASAAPRLAPDESDRIRGEGGFNESSGSKVVLIDCKALPSLITDSPV